MLLCRVSRTPRFCGCEYAKKELFLLFWTPFLHAVGGAQRWALLRTSTYSFPILYMYSGCKRLFKRNFIAFYVEEYSSVLMLVLRSVEGCCFAGEK